MQTRALATLIAIADSGSFVRAAETRNMTLSAVSSQMKSLESTLDATLFDRSFRPPRLTAIGQSVVTHARQVLAAEEMLVQACGRRDRLQGPVRAGFVLSAGVRVMPAFLERAQAPDTALEITVSSGLSRDLLRDVAEGRLDLAVLTLDEAPSADLYHVELAREALVYAVPAPFAADDIQTLARVSTFYQFAPETGIGRMIARHLEALPEMPRRCVVLDGMEAIMACVGRGLGFALLPEPDVQRYARAQDVDVRSVEPDGLSRALSLIARRGHLTLEQWRHACALFDVAGSARD